MSLPQSHVLFLVKEYVSFDVRCACYVCPAQKKTKVDDIPFNPISAQRSKKKFE